MTTPPNEYKPVICSYNEVRKDGIMDVEADIKVTNDFHGNICSYNKVETGGELNIKAKVRQTNPGDKVSAANNIIAGKGSKVTVNAQAGDNLFL